MLSFFGNKMGQGREGSQWQVSITQGYMFRTIPGYVLGKHVQSWLRADGSDILATPVAVVFHGVLASYSSLVTSERGQNLKHSGNSM